MNASRKEPLRLEETAADIMVTCKDPPSIRQPDRLREIEIFHQRFEEKVAAGEPVIIPGQVFARLRQNEKLLEKILQSAEWAGSVREGVVVNPNLWYLAGIRGPGSLLEALKE